MDSERLYSGMALFSNTCMAIPVMLCWENVRALLVSHAYTT